MKAKLFLSFLFCALFFLSCTKKENCTGDCEFVLEKTEAKMMYLSCFDKYGFMVETNGDSRTQMIGIPDRIAAKYQEEGLEVLISGEFRINQLTPGFPDPIIGAFPLYQVNLNSIKKMD